MMRFSLATFLWTCCPDGDVGRGVRLWLSKFKRSKRWASERAAIKAEVGQAKETFDLVRIAHAITRLDALDAEIEAARGKTTSVAVSIARSTFTGWKRR
jgi:hypothetical protein